MPAEREALVPVLVDAPGRSGTTALMQLLASSPSVMTEREYPYESRYLTYLFAWSRLLDGDAGAAGKWGRGRMLPGAPEELGGLPWRELLPDAHDFAAKCFRSAWQHFSDSAPANASHYIEKVPVWIAEQVPEELPTTRVIHLVRDPRDVWLSIASFNERRGFFAFGRRDGQADEEFFNEFACAQRERLGALAGRGRTDGEMLLRYEDMVAAPAATALRVGEWLGLQLDPAALGVRTAHHVTARSAPDSSRRWQRELGRSWRRRFERELGDLIDAFGYGDAADGEDWLGG